MSDTPVEPDGDVVEWEAIFRNLRRTARIMTTQVEDAQDFVMLVDAVETLSSMDPSFNAMCVPPPDDEEGENEEGGDESGDDEEGGEEVPSPAETTL